jgi:hypothetical protein
VTATLPSQQHQRLRRRVRSFTDVPVLVIHGASDAIVSIEVRVTAEAVRGASLASTTSSTRPVPRPGLAVPAPQVDREGAPEHQGGSAVNSRHLPSVSGRGRSTYARGRSRCLAACRATELPQKRQTTSGWRKDVSLGPEGSGGSRPSVAETASMRPISSDRTPHFSAPLITIPAVESP